MIDFHSHILPGMDDGSKSVEQSIEMLTALKQQGITKVVATPHFYANCESVADFIRRRQSCFQKLSDRIGDGLPHILLGAEVRYYEGISRLENLSELCVQGSRMLLLEMPVSTWSEFMLRDLIDLAGKKDIILVLAHIERYLRLQNNGVFEDLLDSGILMQMNSGFVIDFFTRRKALKLLKNKQVHIMGTDCHNMTNRSPNFSDAGEIIIKKLGKPFFDNFISYGNEIFL